MMVLLYTTIFFAVVTIILYIVFHERCKTGSCNESNMDDTSSKISSASLLMTSITFILIIVTTFSSLDEQTRLIVFGILAILCVISSISNAINKK